MPRQWLWKSLPSRGSRFIAGWLSVPRCQGWTVAQAPHRAEQKIAATITTCRVFVQRFWLMLTSRRPRPLWHLRQRLQGLLLLSVAAGCVGSGQGVPAPPEPGATGPKTWAEIQTQILEPTCAQPCHHGGAAPKGLALDHLSAYKALVGVTSAEAPAMLRVAPGKPDESYLIVKVASADPRRIGSRMPRTGPPFLSSPQIAALRQWIAAGATQDWQADAGNGETLGVPGPDAGGEVPDAGSSADAAPGDLAQPSDLGAEQ